MRYQHAKTLRKISLKKIRETGNGSEDLNNEQINISWHGGFGRICNH
jgi:hypothetical protein